MTIQELAQKILDMIKETDDEYEKSTESRQRTLLLCVVTDIEKLCKEQVKGQ